MGWLSSVFSDLGHIGTDIFHGLEKIPGSPEAGLGALAGGLSGKLSWNPFSSGNAVTDFAAGGSQLSQNPNNRKIGRTVGSLAGAAFGGEALLGADAGAGAGSLTGPGSFDAYAAMDAGYAGAGANAGADLGGATASAGGDIASTSLDASPYDISQFPVDPGSGGVPGSSPTSYDISQFPSDPGNGSMYDQMMKYLKGISGKNWARMGLGAYGLYNANQVRKGFQMPNPANVSSIPGYQAGLDAVQARMAQQGYTGGSNAITAMSKYGTDAYNQYVQQQFAGASGQGQAGVGQIGSLALLLGGMGG